LEHKFEGDLIKLIPFASEENRATLLVTGGVKSKRKGF
jgi:hypothetical protein